MRIALFYTDIESFNFFVDQLNYELQHRGHETFILDLLNSNEDTPHSYANFAQFASAKVDAAICFDGMCVRDDLLIEIWDAYNTVVIDILMDPPLRFHSTLVKHSKNYVLFCCDRDHVDYVKRYFSQEVPHVGFMPHVGVIPKKDTSGIPYSERRYDILFSATYYNPQDRIDDLMRMCKENPSMQQFYQQMYRYMIEDSALTTEQAIMTTIRQGGWNVPEDMLRTIFACSENVDWAIRMYQRERVVTALAEAGFELYLLGRGWENHSSAQYSNVHRIDDRIPYAQTLSYMADAKINLNVMPWFKAGTHDRIFNALLQRSLPLTDHSSWIDANFTEGRDIALYDLKHLDQLPEIVGELLHNPHKTEKMIQRGYEKVLHNFTWSNCTDWILSAVEIMR